jgi:hypothetical protein
MKSRGPLPSTRSLVVSPIMHLEVGAGGFFPRYATKPEIPDYGNVLRHVLEWPRFVPFSAECNLRVKCDWISYTGLRYRQSQSIIVKTKLCPRFGRPVSSCFFLRTAVLKIDGFLLFRFHEDPCCLLGNGNVDLDSKAAKQPSLVWMYLRSIYASFSSPLRSPSK